MRSELFVCSSSDDEVDAATSDRFKLDVQLFLMDHARRTMDEFWCEAREGERPYFAAATQELLSIDAYWKMQSRTLDGVILGDQLQELQELSRNTDTLLAHSDRQNKDLDSIRSEEAIEFAFQVPEFLPDGRVTVFGDPKQRRLINTATDAGATTEFQVLVPDSLSKNNNQFLVKTFFRGLRRNGGLYARVLGDPDTVVFNLPDYGPPTALVRAEKQFMNTILVFDCSLSMKGDGCRKRKPRSPTCWISCQTNRKSG